MDGMHGCSPEELAILERISKHGELQAMDRVRIAGLTSEKGRDLNGRIGTVRALSGDNDGRSNPYVAQSPDGRYQVDVEFEETVGEERRPGSFTSQADTKRYNLKRKNLVMEDVGLGTLARDPAGKALLARRGLDVKTTAQGDAEEPGRAGWFPAVLQGDATRTREILEYLRSRGGSLAPAEAVIDATGETALTGAIQKGHPEIVRLLLEYGADPNRCCNMPGFRGQNCTYFLVAIMLCDLNAEKNGEEIVHLLIDGVGDSLRADVNVVTAKGTPLMMAVSISNDHAVRMRICKKLLDRGADPNRVVADPSGSRATVLNHFLGMPRGAYSTSQRMELLQLLIDAGADPGFLSKICQGGRNESANVMHIAVNRRLPDVLRCFLSCEKGRRAVNARRLEPPQRPGENNGHEENAICMCVAGPNLEHYKPDRDMAVQLLRAGADPDMEDHLGLSAAMWLRDRDPSPDRPHKKKEELHGLVAKAAKVGLEFWDSDEVKDFIEQGQNDLYQCDNCDLWEDALFSNGRKVKAFQRCSRCTRVYYCSRECQKKRWKFHKTVCARVPS